MSYSFDKICSNLIPTGKYKVQVTDIKFKSSITGEATHDLMVNYTIVDGPYAKRTLVDTIFEKSFSFRLKPFLQACKIDLAREFATAEELFRFGLTNAKNKIILIDIGVRSYNGKDYNQVTNFYPLPDSTVSATDVLDELGVSPEVKGMSKEDLDSLEDLKEEVSEPELETDLSLDTDDLPY